MNETGWQIYEWLTDRERVDVIGIVTEESQLQLIRRLQPDQILSCGFNHIVPPEILDIPPEGGINLHPGYLPHTRGYNPNVWSIVEDHPPGATLHYMTEDVDAGPIIARTKVKRSFEDDGKSLHRRIQRAAVDLFEETWPKIERREIDPVPQDNEQATYHTKQDFVDLCEIDPTAKYTAREFADILRALTYPPFDNACMELDGDKYNLELDITKGGDGTYVDDRSPTSPP